jgi:hypothetical protein
MYSKLPGDCKKLEFVKSGRSGLFQDETDLPPEHNNASLLLSSGLYESLKTISVASEEDHAVLLALAGKGISPVQAPDRSLVLETSDGALLAVRRTPIPSSQVAEGLPAWTRGLAEERVIGPVWDAVGREVWIHVYRRVQQVRFVRTPGGTPFLSVPSLQFINPVIANTSRTEHGLGEGSLWVATSLFDAAPVNSFCGVRISSGKLLFSEQVAVTGDEVVVPAHITCSAEVVLNPPESLASNLGEDMRASRFQPPETLRIDLSPGGNTIRTIGPAAMKLYGERIDFAPAAEPARYLSGYNRLLVPMTIAETHFDATAAAGPSVEFQGSAPIADGGLALSAAIIDPAQLGQAGGVGALMLNLADGLTARVRSEPEFDDLGPATLMLDAERLAVTALAATHKGQINAVNLGLNGAHGRAEVDRSSTGPLRYFAQADGQETVVYNADVELRPDLPRDVAGDRVPLTMPGATVVLNRNALGLFMGVLGRVANPQRRRCFQIRNALCRTNEPVFAALLGKLDNGRMEAAGLWALHPLNAIVPTLPDPYTSNVSLRRTGKLPPTSILVSQFLMSDTTQDLEMTMQGQPPCQPLQVRQTTR